MRLPQVSQQCRRSRCATAAETLRHVARTGPAHEASSVHEEVPTDQRCNHIGLSAATPATLKFSEISEALRILGEFPIIGSVAARVTFSYSADVSDVSCSTCGASSLARFLRCRVEKCAASTGTQGPKMQGNIDVKHRFLATAIIALLLAVGGVA